MNATNLRIPSLSVRETRGDVVQLLIAEDNPGDVWLIRTALSQEDVNVVVATDGEQALEQLGNSLFDLVMLDLNLTKIDGQTILQLCAKNPGAPPFVIFSGSRQESDRVSAMRDGAKDYVVKPCDLEGFIEAVHGIMDRWRKCPT
jgi:DNA-binding response OmpR family regulator